MVAGSPVIVSGEIRSAGLPSSDQSFTDSLLEVEEVLKGYVAGGRIVVRHPGGPGGRVDRDRLILAEGDRVLLFLGDEENGAYPIAEYPLGMFWEARMGGRSLLLGWGSSAAASPQPAGERWLVPRDTIRFRQWIADRLAGAEPPAAYLMTAQAEAPAVVPSANTAPCTPTSDIFNFEGYRVRLCYRTTDGRTGQGRSGIWASGQSGLFWFFERDNAEALVKVLDGCAINGHRWVFFAPVTDLGLHLRITGPRNRTWTYTNPVGRTARTAADTTAFPCGASPPPPAPPPGGDHHGDGFANATRVAVPSTTRGELEEAGDHDHFRLVLGQAATLTVETTGSTDTYGTLFDGSRASLESDDDDGASSNFKIERSVAAGTYYIRVRGFGSRTTGAYVLRVSAGSRPDDDAFSGSITTCAGREVSSGRWDVTIGGSVRANEALRNVSATGRVQPGGQQVGTQSLGNFSANQTKNCNITGTVTGTAPERCQVEFRGTSGNASTEGITYVGGDLIVLE